MNWDAIGAIGEIVGAFAVVASLAYLAVQIRLQNRESRISTVTQLTEQWNAATTAVGLDGELAKIWTKGLKGDELEEHERVRFFAISSSVINIIEGLYLQKVDGRLDSRTWEGVEGRLNALLSSPGMQDFWLARESWFSSEFAAFINNHDALKSRSKISIYAREIQNDA